MKAHAPISSLISLFSLSSVQIIQPSSLSLLSSPLLRPPPSAPKYRDDEEEIRPPRHPQSHSSIGPWLKAVDGLPVSGLGFQNLVRRYIHSFFITHYSISSHLYDIYDMHITKFNQMLIRILTISEPSLWIYNVLKWVFEISSFDDLKIVDCRLVPESEATYLFSTTLLSLLILGWKESQKKKRRHIC